MTTFSLTFPIGDGQTFTITDGSPRSLSEAFASVGGDGAALAERVKAAAADPTLHAPKPVVVQNTTSPASAASESASASAETKPADPWADEEGSGENPDDDPWSSASDPTSSTSAPSESSPTQGSESTSTVTSTRDNLGREWIKNLPDAPLCHCGVKAAKVKGISQRTNKPYTMWKCEKGSGEGWKGKCEFSDFPK